MYIARRNVRALVDELYSRRGKTVVENGGANPYPLAIDIRTLGAVSGSDATVAIQSAVTLASSNASTGGAVYIPPGTWPTSAPITGADDCVIYGAGYGSIVQPTFSGAPAFSIASAARVFLQTFAIVAMAACTDAVYLNDSQQVVLSGMFINGQGFGFTRGGVTIDGGDCYGTTLTNGTEIFECAGDGFHATPGFTQSAIAINISHIHACSGWGINVNTGAATGTELHVTTAILEGNLLGELTGSLFGTTVRGTHFESTAAGVSCISITGSQRFLGLVIDGNFFENHAGPYCVNINPTGVDSNGLDMAGNFFDQFSTAGAFIGPLVALSRIGPNQANGTAYAGTFGAGVYVLDNGGVFDRQAILRVFSLAESSSFELQGESAQTIGATTATFSYPITVAGFGPATTFTGVVRYEVTAIGRDTASHDFYYAKLGATFSNLAGTVTMGSGGVVDIEPPDHLGGGVAGSAALTVSGSNALLTVTGWAGVTVDWGFIYEAVGRP
jgi:Pectate lyase superfamily protein